MYLKIDENDFGDYHYDRFLTVNGVEKQFSEKEFELTFEEEFEEEELAVVVHFQNLYLRNGDKFRWLHILFNFILRVLDGGYSVKEKKSMCKPYDAVLEFTCKKNARIEMYTNSFTMDRPFTFYRTSPNVSRNEFYADTGYKKRWLLIQVVPKCILLAIIISFFLMAFIGSETGGKVISSLFLVGFLSFAIGYLIYVRKLLRRH